jgi:hypothetical protein
LKPTEAYIRRRPLCKEHEFVADVLAETESVAREMHAQRETAHTAWQAKLRQFRLLSEDVNQLTPSASRDAFVLLRGLVRSLPVALRVPP